MTKLEKLEFTPENVLEAAFAHHDFVGQLGGHDVQVQTSEPIRDGDATYVVVDVFPNSTDVDNVSGASYRYRIEAVPD